MNKKEFVKKAEIAIMVFLFGVLGQYIIDMSGVTRAFHQWMTNWSNIDFVSMLDYMYASRLFHVCAWLILAMSSCLIGLSADEVYRIVID